MRRLSIVDLAGGHQPMLSADGEICVVFNGEIMNAPELRRRLERTARVSSPDHSDTEVRCTCTCVKASACSSA